VGTVPDGWRTTHAFTEPPGRGLLGIQQETGDLTGDGLDDTLTIESIAFRRMRHLARDRTLHGGA
jgi:hypothetical protein